MGFFQNALNFVNEVVIPVFKPAASHANSYYQTAVHPHAASALSEGGEYFKTAVIPAMETALSQAGDFVQTAGLPAATFVQGNIEHAKELSLQVWEGSAGGQSLKDIVMPALDIISPALDFVVKNPWILLPILVPALEAWLLIIGFGVNGIAAGSIAAGMQSNVGNVKKGTLFAFLQSNGAGGFASNAVKMAGKWVLIAIILAAVGKLLIEKGMAEENACGVLEKCWTSVTKDLKTVST